MNRGPRGRVAVLDQLLAYARDTPKGIWLATVAEAADLVTKRQQK